MKLKLIAIVFLANALFVRAQGTFVWDQQFTNITDAIAVLTNTPLGQAFTPTTSSMDAAAFYLSIAHLGTGGDAEVNVRSGSVNGTILGTSDPDAISTIGVYYFTFSSPITLTPGTTYYLQPFEISGSGIAAQLGNTPSGTGQATFGGVTSSDLNFWFQEGVEVIPEPSLAALFLVGGSIAYWHRRKRRIT